MNTKPENRTEQGRFARGVSGNPGGRPKGDAWFRGLCRKRTRKALRALDAALDDPDSRVAAAKVLLEFSWGKAPAHGFDKGGDGTADGKLDGLTSEEITELARRELNETHH